MAGDYSALATAGQPPAEALQDAWLNIYQEYAELCGDTSVRGNLSEALEAELLLSKIIRMESLLVAAHNTRAALGYPHNAILEEIRAEGYAITYDPAQQDLFEQRMAVLAGTIKSLLVRYKTLADGLPGKGRDGTASRVNKGFFTGILIDLSKHFGYPVTRESLTVAGYAIHLAKLREAAKLNQKHAPRHG